MTKGMVAICFFIYVSLDVDLYKTIKVKFFRNMILI